jgi:hypothetical protein
MILNLVSAQAPLASWSSGGRIFTYVMISTSRLWLVSASITPPVPPNNLLKECRYWETDPCKCRRAQSEGIAFKYDPIQKHELRICAIQPADEEAPLACVIEHAHFSPSNYISEEFRRAKSLWDVSYGALSYTWGSTHDKVPIKCGYEENPKSWIYVTRNCVEAIRRVRLPNRPRNLWIDAICIDQGNAQERSIQVQNMHQIFGDAVVVVILLSHESGDGESISNPWKTILTHMYWRRVWVLQELFFARELILHYGAFELDWYQFQDFFRNAAPFNFKLKPDTTNEDALSYRAHMDFVINSISMGHRRPKGSSVTLKNFAAVTSHSPSYRCAG